MAMGSLELPGPRVRAPRRVAARKASLRASFPRSVVAEGETARVERLDDLVDGLLAEVRDGGELALRLRDEVADGLDAGPLEAVVGPHAQLELLDEDVVHRAAGRGAGAVDAGRLPGLQRAAGARAQLLDAVGVGEDRQLGDQHLRGLAQRGLRVDRPV